MDNLKTSTPVNDFDIVIVGAGFAGSLHAFLLGKSKLRVAVIDPHHPYRDDFHCEKFSPEQIDLLTQLNVLPIFQKPNLLGTDPERHTDFGWRYLDMVNSLRENWSSQVAYFKDKVENIVFSEQPQCVILDSGHRLTAKLVILANGISERLHTSLGLNKEILSPQHSIAYGLTLNRSPDFDFEGLVHSGEKVGDGMGYASFFRIKNKMRVNLFTYMDPKSDMVTALRQKPLTYLPQLMPGLKSILKGASLDAPAEMRITTLYKSTGADFPGILLVGDARATGCPATGKGITRILTEALILHGQKQDGLIYQWVESPAITSEKLQDFYLLPGLQCLEDDILQRSLDGRNLAINSNLIWRFKRVKKQLKMRIKDILKGS